jgi:hypothetical protein
MGDGHTHRPAVPARRGRLRTTLFEDATAVLQSVANEVVPGVIEVLDVRALVQRIDVQAIVNQVDMQELLDQIDLQALLEQVDLNALLDRVDLDKLIERLDINALLQRVDVEALVQRTELGTIVTRATGGVAAEAVDGMRSAGVGLDGFVHGWVDRLLHRSKPKASEPADEGAEP